MGGFNRLDPDWYDFYIGVYDDRIHGEFHIVHSLMLLHSLQLQYVHHATNSKLARTTMRVSEL